MPIAKKPKQIEEINQNQINTVISKGGSIATQETNENQKILIRIPNDLLKRVDTDLNSRPLKTPRNTWILEAILEKLEKQKR